MQEKKSIRCLSGSTLKIIALVSMAIDHFAAVILLYGLIYPYDGTLPVSYETLCLIYDIMRNWIGRIAFPIFCFLLVEGFTHTSNRKKYALRLLIFAFLSEIPFDFAIFQTPFTLEHQNVFFTLFLGFVAIWGMDLVEKNKYGTQIQVLIFLTTCGAAYLCKTDYDYYGIILITILYLYRRQPKLQTLFGCLSLLWEATACFAFLPINMYNGKRGLSLKYIFYLFYPIHLLLYGIILQWILI